MSQLNGYDACMAPFDKLDVKFDPVFGKITCLLRQRNRKLHHLLRR